MRHAKIFLILFFSFILAQCADFKDVFNSGHTPRTKTNEHISKDSVQPTKEVVSASDSLARAPILTKEGTYYFVVSQDTLTSIASRYKVSSMALAHVNDMLYDSSLSVGRRIFIPTKKKMAKYVDRKILKESLAKGKTEEKQATRPKPIQDASSKAIGFIWPTEKGPVTSEFGMRRGKPHNGIDIGVASGTRVVAVANAEVVFSEYFSSYGNMILLKHKNGFYTVYAHNRKLLVSKGQKVKQNQQIAESGKTGRASGPHVHFEVLKKNGVHIDPLTVLPKRELVK